METIQTLLEKKVSSMNQDPGKQELIRDWIDGYRGKVIGFRTENGTAFHLVFDQGKAEMRKGNYPSCEFFYFGSEDVLCAILRGENSAMKAGRTGAVKFLPNNRFNIMTESPVWIGEKQNIPVQMLLYQQL